MIVGQEKIFEKLNSYELATLPKALLFLGCDAFGLTKISETLCEKFNLEPVVISPDISADELAEYYISPIPRLFRIDLSQYTEKQQNQLLKMIEEPVQNLHIILNSESEIGLLPTLLNRCIKLQFTAYTPEQLKTFNWLIEGNADQELIYKICHSPSELMSINTYKLNELYELCKMIVEKFKYASFPNAIGIATKINYKEDYNKFDFKTFFRVLAYAALENYKATNSSVAYKIYLFTTTFYQQQINKIIVKESFMINFLIQLWQELRSQDDA